MTYTPASGHQPDTKHSRTVENSHHNARKPVANLKESHLRSFPLRPHPPVQRAQVHSRAMSPATRHFGISVLMDDGGVAALDHYAPAELYLEDVCACFGRGTLIATPKGQVSVEDLRPGDKIKTRDGSEQALRWISRCTLPNGSKNKTDDMAIRIKADALGELRPIQDLVVSPRFRLLTNHPSCEALFGSPETLAPAVDLLDGDTILQVRPAEGMEFFNLMFDAHHIIEANGLETESYHPGNFGIAVMSLEMQSHLRQIFPHLNGDLTRFGRTARPILKGFEAEVLRVV